MHFDGDRTLDSQIVRKHLRSQGLDKLNELAKRIGLNDQSGNVA